MKFDIHVHTDISPCSCLSVEDIVSEAPSMGLAGVCITDHNTMAVGNRLREGIQDNGLCVIFGMEYDTREGDFLLFGPFEELGPGLSAMDLLRLVRAAEGVAVAAHPFRTKRPIQEYLIEQGFCRIIERVNGRNRKDENDKAACWTDRYNIKQVGGSDAHTLAELGQISTRFQKAIRSRSDLIRALKHDDYFVECNHNDKQLFF